MPDDHERRLIELYQGGASAREAAEALGYEESTCLKVLKRNGIPARRCGGKNRLTAGQEQELVGRYRDGETLSALAAAYGFSGAAAVWLLVRRLGGHTRPNKVHGCRDDYFADICTPTQAYVLGFISADGCVTSRPATVAIKLAERDRGLLERIRDEIGYTGPLIRGTEFLNGQPRPFVALRVHSQRLAEDLRALGVVERKSLILSPWPGPPPLLPAYWRGILDGDGSWLMTRNGFRCQLVGSRAVAEGFRDYVASLAGDWKTLYPHVNVWKVCFSHLATLQAVARALYSDATICLERKRAVAAEIMARPPTARPLYRRWSGTTAAHLRELHRSLKTWRAVALHLGTSDSNVARLKKLLGVS